MNITFEPMTKGRHFFKCYGCGQQAVTRVAAARITHYCFGRTLFEAHPLVPDEINCNYDETNC